MPGGGGGVTAQRNVKILYLLLLLLFVRTQHVYNNNNNSSRRPSGWFFNTYARTKKPTWCDGGGSGDGLPKFTFPPNIHFSETDDNSHGPGGISLLSNAARTMIITFLFFLNTKKKLWGLSGFWGKRVVSRRIEKRYSTDPRVAQTKNLNDRYHCTVWPPDPAKLPEMCTRYNELSLYKGSRRPVVFGRFISNVLTFFSRQPPT